jgi:hypothetical protein
VRRLICIGLSLCCVAGPGTAHDCDPNYGGVCVAVSSDVDCASGSGNGLDYVQGPVYVIGDDLYGLDRAVTASLVKSSRPAPCEIVASFCGTPPQYTPATSYITGSNPRHSVLITRFLSRISSVRSIA